MLPARCLEGPRLPISEVYHVGSSGGGTGRKASMFICLAQWFANCGPSTSSNRISRELDVYILCPHLRLTGFETLGWDPIVCVLRSLPGDSFAGENL